jgi:hypothetical protein
MAVPVSYETGTAMNARASENYLKMKPARP